MRTLGLEALSSLATASLLIRYEAKDEAARLFDMLDEDQVEVLRQVGHKNPFDCIEEIIKKGEVLHVMNTELVDQTIQYFLDETLPGIQEKWENIITIEWEKLRQSTPEDTQGWVKMIFRVAWRDKNRQTIDAKPLSHFAGDIQVLIQKFSDELLRYVQGAQQKADELKKKLSDEAQSLIVRWWYDLVPWCDMLMRLILTEQACTLRYDNSRKNRELIAEIETKLWWVILIGTHVDWDHIYVTYRVKRSA